MKTIIILELILDIIMVVLGLLILLEKIEINPILALVIMLYGIYIFIRSLISYKRKKYDSQGKEM